MDMDLKLSLRTKVDSIAPEYGLFDLAYPSFIRAAGYQPVLSASDSVESIGALLEVGTGIRLDFGREEGFKTWGGYVRGEEDDLKPKATASQSERAKLQPIENGADRPQEVINENDARVDYDDQWWVKNFWLAWNALSSE